MSELAIRTASDIAELENTADCLAAYALNMMHGAVLADFERDNILALAKRLKVTVTPRQEKFLTTRKILDEIFLERLKQVDLGFTPEQDAANPMRLHDEILSRVSQLPMSQSRTALVEAAAIIAAEIEMIDLKEKAKPTGSEGDQYIGMTTEQIKQHNKEQE